MANQCQDKTKHKKSRFMCTTKSPIQDAPNPNTLKNLVLSCGCLAESLEARCQVENENVVGAAPTGDAPTTSEWSTILLPTKVRLILEVCQFSNMYALFLFLLQVAVITHCVPVTSLIWHGGILAILSKIMPLPEPMLTYCQLNPSQQILEILESKYNDFHSRKMSSAKCRPFWLHYATKKLATACSVSQRGWQTSEDNEIFTCVQGQCWQKIEKNW